MHEPSSARMRAALGDARGAWDDLAKHLAEAYRLTSSLHFMYGARYGWALRFERGGRLAVAMYPNRGYLTVQVILNQEQVAAASRMHLPPAVARALQAAKDYPEGRWLFVQVTTPDEARELRPLVALKLSRPTRGAAEKVGPAARGRSIRP